jgi:hypothetical protein
MAKGKKKGGKRGKGGRGMPANPPQLRVVTSVRKTFRHVVTTAFVQGTLNESELLMLPGAMGTVTNTTLVATQVSVKLHGIRIWGTAPAAGAASTVSIRWFGVQSAAVNATAIMDVIQDTSTNPAHAPHVQARPPPGSRLSFWLSADNAGSDELLAITAPVGSVVDFDVEFNHGMPSGVGSFTYSASTVTVGVMYWVAMVAITGTGIMSPPSLATTV